MCVNESQLLSCGILVCIHNEFVAGAIKSGSTDWRSIGGRIGSNDHSLINSDRCCLSGAGIEDEIGVECIETREWSYDSVNRYAILAEENAAGADWIDDHVG